MLRRLAVSALIIAATALGPSAPAPSRAAGMTDVSFSLNWIKNVEFGGLWVAQAKGWWAQAGLNVTARAWDYTSDPVQLVGAGKYTFGFQDGASLILGRAAGIPVQAVWSAGQKSPFAFISMPNSGIKTVKDFKGKRIGYQGHERYVLETMLNHEGLSINDVKPVVVGFDPQLLVVGKVDAYLAFLTNEPIQLALKNHIKVNIIKASDYGYDFYNDVLFTTDSTIKNQPDLVRKVVAVMDRGWRYAIAHPAEVAKIVVPKLDNGDSIEQQTTELQLLAPMAKAADGSVGSMTSTRWQYGTDLLLKYKQIKATVPVSQVFTNAFIPKQ